VVNSCVATVIFLIGLNTNLSIFTAEVIAEFMIGVGMARRIWIKR